MKSISLIAYYTYKELFDSKSLSHKNGTELFEDVDRDVFRRTHSFEHQKYTKKLLELFE